MNGERNYELLFLEVVKVPLRCDGVHLSMKKGYLLVGTNIRSSSVRSVLCYVIRKIKMSPDRLVVLELGGLIHYKI